MAPFGEIVANPSDLKHAGELLRYSDGLGVVILAHAHRWDEFYSVYGTTQSGMNRRLVDFLPQGGDATFLCHAVRRYTPDPCACKTNPARWWREWWRDLP